MASPPRPAPDRACAPAASRPACTFGIPTTTSSSSPSTTAGHRGSRGGGPMSPRDVVGAWVEAFNRADADALAAFYTDDAINHQVAESPVQGRDAIRRMFAAGFAAATMVCIVENLFEDGEWAILEWR